jgi:tungstate transport system substrate-binding protein
MNMTKKIATILSLLVLVAILLSACATPAAPTQMAEPTKPPAPAQEQKPTDVPKPTDAPKPTEAPKATEAPKPTEAPAAEKKLILATTTSTQDSGLLEYLLPDFEKEFGAKIDVIAVGTGQALKLGEDGNADVLLVHSRAKEDEYMKNGHGTRREDVMYNDFVIVGPEGDPAGIKGAASATDAFKLIAEKQEPFISRGDESGTHTKEKSIWTKAEIEPAGDWYISAGQGMGEVLTMAEEQQAYTLSDRATYLARTKDGLKLAILVEGGKDLLNPYGVIAVDPAKNPKIQADLATQFIDWIISLPVQEKIAEFGKADFGQSLFNPSSAPWMEAHPAPAAAAPAASGIPADAALKVTGKVQNEVGWSEDQVKAMNTLEVESTNKQGQIDKYTGVLIADLLKLAGPLPEATKVVFVADDGFTAEIALADIMACADCIVSFRSKGGFSTVLPGQPGNMQVKGVVEIKVE